jgi:hypothetical protein
MWRYESQLLTPTCRLARAGETVSPGAGLRSAHAGPAPAAMSIATADRTSPYRLTMTPQRPPMCRVIHLRHHGCPAWPPREMEAVGCREKRPVHVRADWLTQLAW